MLGIVNCLGGPPAWEFWEPTEASIDADAGELWVPSGILMAYYTQIRVSYVAGWSYTALPTAIKQACANIIRAAQDNPISGNISSFTASTYKTTKFADTLIDGDTKTILTPFKTKIFI